MGGGGSTEERAACITNLSDLPSQALSGSRPQQATVCEGKQHMPPRKFTERSKPSSIPSHRHSEYPNSREAKLIKCCSTLVRRLSSIKLKTYIIVFTLPDKSL